MRFDLNKELNIHVKSLSLRSRRAEILAANIANADTPFYQAKDMDFKSALQRSLSTSGDSNLRKTSDFHQEGISDEDYEVKYRVPMQTTLDKNTVDAEQEYVRFSDNALHYQASMKLLGQKFKDLLLVIGG